MSITKIFFGLLLALTLIAGQINIVQAAPPLQETTTITGSVETIVLETDANGSTVVVVTLTDSEGTTQTLRLDVDTALSLSLVTLDASGNPIVSEGAIGTTVEIIPTTVLTEEVEQLQHPVGAALSNFFSSVLGVDYETIMATHEEGVGFGVIAQALWLTNALEGDTELFSVIVDAKQSGDYSSIVLPDGTSPKNWGQFRKVLLDHKQNLGQIMSGHASNGSEETTTTESASPNNGNSNGQGNNGQGNGNNGNNGNGKDKNNAKGNPNKP